MNLDIPTYSTLALAIEDQVATVSLNRPDKANSMNLAMWSELQACFDWLDAEPTVRAVVLAAIHSHCIGGGVDMTAREAREVGLVNRVFPDRDTLLEEVQAIAHTIASKSPLAIRSSKEMLLYSRDDSVADGLNHIATWNAGMLSYTDLQAGLEAQMEKRQAVYED